MIKDVFKSITRGFGYSLGKLLFFGLLGLIAFIIGSKAYALETNTIVGINQSEYTFPNTLGYDYSNYNPTTTYHYIKEQINDNSIDFNYLVTLDNECWSSIYIQEKNFFSNYYNADTSKLALFNYRGGYNFDRYDMFNYGLEYNMKINYNFCQNVGEVLQPLRIGDIEPYYYGINNSVYGSILDYIDYKDLHILDMSTSDFYWIPTFSNYEAIRWSQGQLLWLYGPNSMYLPTLGNIPFTNSYNNATGGGGSDNPPSEETGKDYTNILEEISSKIGTGFQNVIETIQEGFNDLKEFFLDVSGLNSIINSFNTLKTSIDGIKEDLRSYLNSITGFFTNLINGITNGTCEPIIIPLTSFGIDNNIVLPCIGTNVRNYNETITIIFDSICYIIFGLGIIIYLFNTITGFSFFKQDNLEVDSHL